MKNMKKKILWITETAVMLAMLVTLQWVTKPMGQLVTGSCVNAVLVVSTLVGGFFCGLTVALISPVLAFTFGITNVLVVPVIMVGNTVLVVLYNLILKQRSKENIKLRVLRHGVAWITSAAAKFAVMYAIVNWLICGVLSESLLAAGTLKPPMLKALPTTFGILQLCTALIGGAVALMIVPILRKALKRK